MTSHAVIFDVEGTLMYCVPLVLECWHLTLAEAGHTVLRSDLQRYSGMDGNDMLDRLLPDSWTSEKERLLKVQGERYRHGYLSRARPFPGVPELLSRLKDRRYMLGIATTCKNDELKAYDEHMDALRFI